MKQIVFISEECHGTIGAAENELIYECDED